MNRKLLQHSAPALCLIMLLSFLLAGCGAASPTNTTEPQEPTTTEALLVADPAGAIQAIYDTLEEYSATLLNGEEMAEVLDFSSILVSDAYISVSDSHFGLADILILKPLASSRDRVREELYRYKDRRVQESENYDILGSYAIAQDAVVYDQGNYVILLMLADNEAGKMIIDQYIPQ